MLLFCALFAGTCQELSFLFKDIRLSSVSDLNSLDTFDFILQFGLSSSLDLTASILDFFWFSSEAGTILFSSQLIKEHSRFFSYSLLFCSSHLHPTNRPDCDLGLGSSGRWTIMEETFALDSVDPAAPANEIALMVRVVAAVACEILPGCCWHPLDACT